MAINALGQNPERMTLAVFFWVVCILVLAVVAGAGR